MGDILQWDQSNKNYTLMAYPELIGGFISIRCLSRCMTYICSIGQILDFSRVSVRYILKASSSGNSKGAI
jgi:hypothetical protein